MASIEHRVHTGSETWRVVWRQGGRKQQMAFPDAAQAGRFHKLVEGSRNRWPAGWEPKQPGPPPGLTFASWAGVAIERRSRASDRTKADYRRDLERHFELIAHVPIDALTEDHVVAWMRNRRDAGLSDKTIRNLHGFASSLLADAMSQKPPVAEHNPFANRLTERVAVRTEDMVFLTPPEFALVLGHVRDERNYPQLIRLLYGTGLRYGEATALQVRDVELLGKRKTLTVSKAWKRNDTNGYDVGEPKTPRSRRTIGISPELVDMLIPLVASRRSSELLFPGAGGGRLPAIEVYKRAWAPAVARANVCATHWDPQRDGRDQRPRLPDPCDCAGVLGTTPRIHDLRHSHVAALITEGVAIAIISRRLGHSSINITMDRYGHLDPSLDDQVNAAVDRSLVLS